MLCGGIVKRGFLIGGIVKRGFLRCAAGSRQGEDTVWPCPLQRCVAAGSTLQSCAVPARLHLLLWACLPASLPACGLCCSSWASCPAPARGYIRTPRRSFTALCSSCALQPRMGGVVHTTRAAVCARSPVGAQLCLWLCLCTSTLLNVPQVWWQRVRQLLSRGVVVLVKKGRAGAALQGSAGARLLVLCCCTDGGIWGRLGQLGPGCVAVLVQGQGYTAAGGRACPEGSSWWSWGHKGGREVRQAGQHVLLAGRRQLAGCLLVGYC